MTTLALPLKGSALFLDNSTLERYTKCPRSYEYYGINKRELANDRDALAFGRLIHECLDRHYTGKPLAEIQAHIDAFYKANPHVGASTQRTSSAAHAIMTQYAGTYQCEPFDICSNAGKPLVECAFAEPIGTITTQSLGEIPVIWTGRIDMVASWGSDLMTIDHKTSSMEGNSFWADFELSQAQLGYAWAASRILGRPVNSFLINAIVLTKSGNLKLLRNKYYIETGMLEEWRDNTLAVIENLVADTERGFLAQHKAACVHKYGTCDYHGICKCMPSQRATVLNSNLYQDVTWSPLE
jgi:hypothetical protein